MAAIKLVYLGGAATRAHKANTARMSTGFTQHPASHIT